MERVPQLVRRGKKDRRMGAPSELDWEAIEALRTEMRVELIAGIDTAWAGGGGAGAGPKRSSCWRVRGHARKGDGEVIYRHLEQPGLGTPGRAASSGPGPSGARSGGRGASGVVRAIALGGGRGGTRGCSARSCLGSRVVTTRPRWRQCRGRSGCRSRRYRGSSRRRPPGS